MNFSRRNLMAGIGGAGGGLILGRVIRSKSTLAVVTPEPSEDLKEGEVTAVEDLMREHGVLRRALFVYSESARRLRKNPSEVSPGAIEKAAKLFRGFGEDYHEKKLEEAFIFPAVKKAGGGVAGIIEILIAQHSRGREITDYILSLTKAAKFDAGGAESLARVMESLVRMYRPHAAREDTLIFPAWKQTMNAKQLDEMGDKFEDIQHKIFGTDGFESAVGQISDIEKELGLADLAQFTAPGPSSS